MYRVGFLLVEMACALFLVSMMSLVLARSYYTMSRIEQDSIRRLQALSLVQECAEKCIAKQNHERSGECLVALTTTKMSSEQPGFVLTKITARWPTVCGGEQSITTYVGAFSES